MFVMNNDTEIKLCIATYWKTLATHDTKMLLQAEKLQYIAVCVCVCICVWVWSEEEWLRATLFKFFICLIELIKNSTSQVLMFGPY